MARHRFTERWLQAASLVPTSGRAEYIDGLCPGLHLRITVKGTRTFSTMFRVNGELRRKTIGTYPVVTLANARASALAIMRKAQEAGSARELRARAVESITYKELVEAYTAKHLKPNARSWKSIYSGLTGKAMQQLFTLQAGSVTRRDIIDVVDSIVEAGSPQSAVNQLRRLKMLFNWAASRDMIDSNPTDGVRPPAKTTERDRVLTDGEIASVWRATITLPPPFGQMYQMFFLTGQRRSEVSRMQWKEVSGNVWTIPREKVKKDRPHVIPLGKVAMDVLASLPCTSPDGYVFSTTGGEASSSNFTKTKGELEAASGTSGWTIHDIRRTVRSKLAELGVPREVAAKVLNHEAGTVDRIYNRHEYLREKREALAKWEKMLLSIASSRSQRWPRSLAD